jgi:hypothetical protein
MANKLTYIRPALAIKNPAHVGPGSLRGYAGAYFLAGCGAGAGPVSRALACMAQEVSG